MLELGLVFVLGLVSSLHCVQMCGPIVLAFSLPLNRSQVLRAHVQYNAGRILTYCHHPLLRPALPVGSLRRTGSLRRVGNPPVAPVNGVPSGSRAAWQGAPPAQNFS